MLETHKKYNTYAILRISHEIQANTEGSKEMTFCLGEAERGLWVLWLRVWKGEWREARTNRGGKRFQRGGTEG